MSVLARYLMKSILAHTFMVMLVLLTLSSLYLFIDQQNDIGQSDDEGKPQDPRGPLISAPVAGVRMHWSILGGWGVGFKVREVTSVNILKRRDRGEGPQRTQRLLDRKEFGAHSDAGTASLLCDGPLL